MKVFSVAEMVAAEQSADSTGHTYAGMMEQAGHALADAILERFPINEQSILVLIGPGNNGGDGLVAARHLANAGAVITAYLTKPRDPIQDVNFATLQEMGIHPLYSSEDPDNKQLAAATARADIIIDALLGTGVTRPISGNLAGILKTVAKYQHKPRPPANLVTLSATKRHKSVDAKTAVIAVDCPSGVNCDSGICDKLTLSAEITITFAGPKRGHFLFPAAAACGDLIVADIGIAPTHIEHIATDVATSDLISELLPPRPLDGHKGTFGAVTVIGGSADYLGAPLLSATGALRAGAGVVSTILPAALRMMAASRLPESSYPVMPDRDYLGENSAESILSHLHHFKNKKSALLIGPGLGSRSDNLLATLFDSDLPPLVLDADCLNYLSRQPDWSTLLPHNTILTPHPVELGRLAGRNILHENRFDLALNLAQKWQHTLVLKGAYTIIASPEGLATTIPIATPALAVGGSGDVLAGVICALLARGLAPYKAAIAGTWLHAAAGQRLANASGSSGSLASEIANQIPHVTP